MTYNLQTLNMGEIEAGYFSVFTQEVKIGEISISIYEFCRAVARLASEIDYLIIPTTGKMKAIACSRNLEQKVVKLGQYKIRGDKFGAFADYVFHGGFLGWKSHQPEWKPEFVKSAIDFALKHDKDKKKKWPLLNLFNKKEFKSWKKYF